MRAIIYPTTSAFSSRKNNNLLLSMTWLCYRVAMMFLLLGGTTMMNNNNNNSSSFVAMASSATGAVHSVSISTDNSNPKPGDTVTFTVSFQTTQATDDGGCDEITDLRAYAELDESVVASFTSFSKDDHDTHCDVQYDSGSDYIVCDSSGVSTTEDITYTYVYTADVTTDREGRL